VPLTAGEGGGSGAVVTGTVKAAGTMPVDVSSRVDGMGGSGSALDSGAGAFGVADATGSEVMGLGGGT
jgi:hypothetical protein